MATDKMDRHETTTLALRTCANTCSVTTLVIIIPDDHMYIACVCTIHVCICVCMDQHYAGYV